MKTDYGKCYFNCNLIKYDVDEHLIVPKNQYISQLFYNPNDNLITIYFLNANLYPFYKQPRLLEFELEEFREQFHNNPIAMEFINKLTCFQQEIEQAYYNNELTGSVAKNF